MADQKSEDWLPDGWTVEVKVRRNGKRDKCYFAPSSGLKFNSKPEVSRYLKSIEINCPSPEEKKEDTGKRSREHVVIEKDAGDGLPPGWIKKIKVKKQGRKIRRDPYYTDPVSGYVFRSMKDVLRYLKTGELGRLAIKPKDKGSNDVELEDDKISSPAVAKKQRLAVSGTRRRSNRIQSLKLQGTVKDDQILQSACRRECISLSEHTSEQVDRADGALTKLSCSNLTETGGSEKEEGKVDSAKSDLVSAPEAGVLLDKQLLKDVMMKPKVRKPGLHKSKTKESNLPRRCSKRLAGLELNPMLELNSISHSQRVKVKKSDAALINTEVSLDSNKSQHPSVDLSNPKEHAGKMKRKTNVREKKEYTSVFPRANLVIPEEFSGKTGKGNDVDDKPDCLLNLPFGDLLADPCIEFAIRTLTGRDFNAGKSPDVSSKSNTGNHYSGDLATLTTQEMNGRKVGIENIGDDKKGVSLISQTGKLSIPEEHDRKVETESKANEKAGAHLDSPLEDLWADPCISFAVKTLTGAIPVDCDIEVQDYFQLQCSSSQTQANSTSTLSNVGVDNLFQASFTCQQFGATNKPILKQRTLVEPALLPNGSVSLRNSGGTNLHQHGENRSNGFQR